MFLKNKKIIIIVLVMSLVIIVFIFWFFTKKEEALVNVGTLKEIDAEKIMRKLEEEKGGCKKIEDPEDQNLCIYKIVNELALRNQEPTLCQEHLKQEARDNCIKSLALEGAREEICELITEEKKQNECLSLTYHKKAQEAKDLNLCKKIPLKNYQNSCFSQLVSKYDLAFCEALEGLDKDKCSSILITQEAFEKTDLSLCEKIPLEEERLSCLGELKGVIQSIDSDSDGLTDEEEVRYGTDPRNPDSDADGYQDGEEVSHGYNPLGAGKL